MRENPLFVYAGAVGALAVMTVLSAGAGWLVPTLFSERVAHWCFVALFAVFGVRLLQTASAMKTDGVNEEELAEVEQELGSPAEADTAGVPERLTAGGVFLKAFVTTFLAEWGDRSQIATIALAAEKSVFGVTLGGILGHAVCTAIACAGGKVLARRISERVVTYVGGALFLFFAVATALE
jgi:putative Ca2+/H+ antiporter (TMEM165/GDT1 family)